MAPSPTPTMVNLTGWPADSKITVGWDWGSARSWTGTLSVQIWVKADSGSWGNVKTFTPPDGREAWDHPGRSSNVEYSYKVRYTDDLGNGDFSNTLSITLFDDSADDTIELDENTSDLSVTGDVGTDTITLDETTSEAGALSDSTDDTVALIDSVSDIYTLSLSTDYGYYFGDFSGNVYHEHEDYGSDDGTAISAYWLSKETDFADVDKDALSKYKTVYRVRLFYVDQTAGQSVTVSVSTDGGTNWTGVGRSVGNGDETVKSADFFCQKTSDVFQFKVAHNADSGKFQWINLEVYYSLGGEYCEI